jgi:hypothetical protein
MVEDVKIVGIVPVLLIVPRASSHGKWKYEKAVRAELFLNTIFFYFFFFTNNLGPKQSWYVNKPPPRLQTVGLGFVFKLISARATEHLPFEELVPTRDVNSDV